MGKVVVDLSMSLDGFIAGPNDGPDNGLGDGGERLHEWLFNGDTASVHNEIFKLSSGSAQVFDESLKATGAVVMGRRWFDIGEQPWGDDPPFRVPVFVLTHRARTKLNRGKSTFTFVTDGIESALEKARAAAGDKDVAVGAANIAQQYLKAGLLDEIQIHLVPILLGGGVRLFRHLGNEPIELERIKVIESPDVTHLRLRIVK